MKDQLDSRVQTDNSEADRGSISPLSKRRAITRFWLWAVFGGFAVLPVFIVLNIVFVSSVFFGLQSFLMWPAAAALAIRSIIKNSAGQWAKTCQIQCLIAAIVFGFMNIGMTITEPNSTSIGGIVATAFYIIAFIYFATKQKSGN